MAETVEQIRQKIAKLQAKEEALLAKEVDGVVARIQEAIAFYKLTPERLFGTTAKPAGRGKKSASKPALKRAKGKAERGAPAPAPSATPADRRSLKGTKLPAKYKDEDGNTWSGRGSQPRWLKAAIEGGKTLEYFAA